MAIPIQVMRVIKCTWLPSSVAPAKTGTKLPKMYSRGCANSAEMETSFDQGVLVTL